jgi:hypothetical protein
MNSVWLTVPDPITLTLRMLSSFVPAAVIYGIALKVTTTVCVPSSLERAGEMRSPP